MTLYLFSSSHYPVLWIFGVAAAGIGGRALDRRVKLRIGPEGIFYASWGGQPILWSEFEGFAISRQQNVVVEARVKQPDQFRARLPLSARLDAWLNPRFGRPPFSINPTQLDQSAEKILEVLGNPRG